MLILIASAIASPPEEWETWVRAGHPEWACVQAETPLCAWPGSFALDARADGASFVLGVRVDKDSEVALPGGREAWPETVRAGGRDVVVLDRGGVPTAVLPAGTWRLEGTYRWTAMPQGLTIPAALGIVRVRVAGQEITTPRIDGGVLRLGTGDAPGESRLELDVLRHVVDGVPAVVETRVVVRAAGASREVDLGKVLLDNTRAVAIKAELPARLGPEGELVIQARPGTWTVQVDAVVQGPLTGLTMREMPAPWPENEYWAVTTDDAVRAVTLAGPPGVDPGRTPLADDWKGLPTFRVSAGQVLGFAELRRGQPNPPPNRLDLRRELWLDFDGDGITTRDSFHGQLNRGWRLDLLAPGVLGHAAEAGEDQVVTVGDGGATGVELRDQALNLLAESRTESTASLLGTSALPAVGWATDVHSLATTIHLPTGWSLVHADGVDHAPGSLVERWSLLDAVLCLLITLASFRLGGPLAAITGLGAAVLTRQVGYAPGWSWLVLLVIANLAPVLGRRGRVVATLVVIGILVAVTPAVTVGLLSVAQREPAFQAVGDLQSPNDGDFGRAGTSGPSSGLQDHYVELLVEKKADQKTRNISVQKDATEAVQTGPGVPGWRGEVYSLDWDGPVEADHTMRLVLLSPWGQRAMVIAGFVLLAVSTWASARRVLPRILPAAALAILLVPRAHAEDTPPAPPAAPWEVDAVTARLAPTACPECVSVPRLSVRVDGDRLRILAEVHASAAGTWALPGPATSWMPADVRVDGAPAYAMTRRADGFVLLRVDPGVHRVEIEGQVETAVALQFGLPPKHLDVDAPGWVVDGVRPDGSAEASLSLARMSGDSATTELSPRVEVHRFLDLGFPWRIRTTVSRVGTGDRPVSLKVPLLDGEAVTDDGFVVKDGAVAISLGQTGEVQWLSTLAPVDALTLKAAEGVAWTELWEISCSPVYACTIDGLPPLSYVQDGAWSPRFRPWPGESLTLHVARREAAEGQTLTVDGAELTWKPGPRVTLGTLELSVRSSQGGALPVTFPAGTSVVGVTIDGKARPMEGKDGRIELPLQPGHQALTVEVQLPWTLASGARLPTVELGAPAVNLRTTVTPPQGRWTAMVWGPGEGAVWGMGIRLGLLLVLAALATRYARGFGAVEWALLALGMNQLPAGCFGLVVIAVALLTRPEPVRARLGGPLGSVVLWGAAVGTALVIGVALLQGLAGEPDMRIIGPGSSRWSMSWFVDRSAGELPRPLVVSLPLWTLRAAMLAWTLWLLARATTWVGRFREALRWVGPPPKAAPPIPAE